jgi:deoxycytidylate deaminase
MRVLRGSEEAEARVFMQRCARIAGKSGCFRSRCGSLIVIEGRVIGRGVNGPPGGLESQRRCLGTELGPNFKSDRTCCVHAEQRAVSDALRGGISAFKGSRLYFARLDEFGALERAGEPYCTICSKIVLDTGISEFVLWHSFGITVYGTEEYNDRSFAYGR